MSKWRDDYSKLLTKKTWKEQISRPKAADIIEQLKQQAHSPHPLRTLGFSDSGAAVNITEEERESHIHILGSPGEGKSKFLELLLRQDIDNGYGACLLDPSDNGDTMYKVLKYAIKKGHQKIVLIDPHDIRSFNAVPTINPIHYKAPAPAIIGSLMDAMRVLWGTKDFTDTPRIQKYLPAVLSAIHASKKTLADVKWFLERDVDDKYEIISTEFPPEHPSKVGIRKINYTKSDDGKRMKVLYFEMVDGGIVYSRDVPPLWRYLLLVLYPACGFILPWGILKTLAWVGAGFFKT